MPVIAPHMSITTTPAQKPINPYPYFILCSSVMLYPFQHICSVVCNPRLLPLLLWTSDLPDHRGTYKTNSPDRNGCKTDILYGNTQIPPYDPGQALATHCLRANISVSMHMPIFSTSSSDAENPLHVFACPPYLQSAHHVFT